jgi:tRNA A37 methylthiotransferase MiaB
VETHNREAYLDLIHHVRHLIPGVRLSSDFICGFCGETEEEFEDTLTLISEVKYNMAFLFAYSLREVSSFSSCHVYMRTYMHPMDPKVSY